MSYHLAVWEGPPPISNAHGASECQRQLAARAPQPPSPAIGQLLAAVTEAFPADAVGSGPWADGGPDGQADGSFAYLSVADGWVDRVAPVVEKAAADLDLVAFDPQRAELLPSATVVARTGDFELPPAEELPLHLGAVIGEALGAGRPMAGVLEEVSSEFYVQWLAKDGALTIEAQGDQLLAPQLQLDESGRSHMVGLGFVDADPNWRQHWTDGAAQITAAAKALTDVLMVVRAIPQGTAMALQTFPV